MKQLTCEMCGSTDLIKQDGVFVCETCGTKYSVEEAKKMMVEGTVDVTGSTVRIDQSREIKNLYELARRAKNDNNSENAQKYYEQLLLMEPSSWEANFYTVYYQSRSCKISQIESAAIKLNNCEDTILQLIKDNIPEQQEQRKAVNEMGAKLINISQMFYSAAIRYYKGLDESIRSDHVQEMVDNCCAARDICYDFGDYVIKFFGDDYGKDFAAPCWEVGITQHNGVMAYFAEKEENKNVIMDYVSKIQKYDSSYTAPTIDTIGGGCYVATAVYGSYDCPQVWTLRRFRDYTLAKTWHGRLFIKTYYAISPTIVKWFGHTEWFKKMWKNKLDRMVANLNAEGVENIPYEDKTW